MEEEKNTQAFQGNTVLERLVEKQDDNVKLFETERNGFGYSTRHAQLAEAGDNYRLRTESSAFISGSQLRVQSSD